MGLFQATGQLIVKISLEKTLSDLEEAQNVKRVHFMTCQQAVYNKLCVLHLKRLGLHIKCLLQYTYH